MSDIMQSIRFINREQTTIEVLYEREDGVVYPHIFEVDDPEFDELGMDIETIETDTRAYNRASFKEHKRFFDQQVAEAVLLETNVSNSVEYILNSNADTDAVFKAKISAMETDVIKSSDDRQLKQELRKAKTLIDVYSIALRF